jgi:hypothetical protein
MKLTYVWLALMLAACSRETPYKSSCGPKPGDAGAEMEKWQKCDLAIRTGIERANQPEKP